MSLHKRMGRRASLIGGGLALTLGSLWLFRDRRRGDLESGRRYAEEIGQRHGVRIVLVGLSTETSDGRAARLPEIHGGTTTPVDPGVLLWALDSVEQSLGAYPSGFYGRYCATIFVCGSLTLDGRSAGGTYGTDWVVLSAPSAHGRGTVEETCRLGIHHEFSSIVWTRTLTLPGRWTTLLPPNWAFAQSNSQALDAVDAEPPALTTGFLSAYGSTSPENDFNIFAETVFTQPARLMELARHHHVIAAKLALVLDTYIDLDSRMDDVFRRLGLGTLIGTSHDLVPGGRGLSPLHIPSGQIVEPQAQ